MSRPLGCEEAMGFLPVFLTSSTGDPMFRRTLSDAKIPFNRQKLLERKSACQEENWGYTREAKAPSQRKLLLQ